MEKQATERLVHHYDTERHRILCGSARPDDHSTKHVRGVTCPACIALIRERLAAESGAAASSSQGV